MTNAKWETVEQGGTTVNVLRYHNRYGDGVSPQDAFTTAGKVRCQARPRTSNWGTDQCSRAASEFEPMHATYSSGNWSPSDSMYRNVNYRTPVRNARNEVIGYTDVLFGYCKQHSMKHHNAKQAEKDLAAMRLRAALEEHIKADRRKDELLQSLLLALDATVDEPEFNTEAVRDAFKALKATGVHMASAQFYRASGY